VEQTDVAARSGKGLFHFKNDATKDFLAQFKDNFEASEGAILPKQAQQWANPNGAPRGWLSPIAGDSEYSGGSWMPNTLTHRGRTHAAMDVYAKRGTPIVAPVGGTVLSVRTGKIGGHTVRVRGDDGLTYYFAHMDSSALVKPGQKLRPGAHLGFVGNSGSAKNTKPHLHFSIKKGSMAVNPKTYLDGAKNAGNYFAPGGPEHTVERPRSTSEKMDGLLNSVANQVAGGSRTDYRTLGLDIDEPDETDKEQTIVDNEKRED
jgi:murein DD-endopeptidase MepM/ murein hydrolase activator NlpD